MKKRPILVSVLCAVRNEHKTIKKNLSSLVHQDYNPKEIVIIDDGSTDGTSEIASQYAKKYKNVRYFRIKHVSSGSHTEPRLFGIRKLRGAVIFVVDADAYYDTNYLRLCMNQLKNPDVGGVIGRMVMWDPANFVAKYREAWYAYRFSNPTLIDREIKNGKIAAWVFKRAVYEKVGGYDPKNHYGEDVDLAKRIQDAGFKVTYEPRAVWHHKWEDTFFSITKKFFTVGRLNYYHRRRDLKMFFKVGYFFSFILFLLFSFFNSLFLYFLILHPFPLVVVGLYRFYLCRKTKFRAYILLYPFLSYLMNIPYTIGFLSKALEKN